MNKKIIFSLALIFALSFSSELKAENYLGVKLGYGTSYVRMFPYADTSPLWGMFSGTIAWRNYTTEKYVGGIEVDLEFMQKGYILNSNYPYSVDETSYYVRRFNAVQLPVMWQPNISLFDEKMRIFINLGIFVSYHFNSTYAWDSELSGVIEQGDYEMLTYRDNRFGYGLCGGLGVSYVVKRWEVFAEARYYYCYSDILKNKTQYEYNPLRSQVDNISVNLGVFYRLGKKQKQK